MARWALAFCLLAVCEGLGAQMAGWAPAAGHEQIAIWPHGAPDLKPMPGPETKGGKAGTDGKPRTWVRNVAEPTMTVYSPSGANTGAAVVVFPGGGFEILAMDLEGTEICDWLTSAGITCVLLKYRVPSEPYDWHCDCRPRNLMVPRQALDDAQRTMGLVRAHAREWHVDPHKVGVIGFSAGGFLVAEISTHFSRRLYTPIDAADNESARPDFAIAIYPGHIASEDGKMRLNPNVPVTRDTPPTFLLQAEDDKVDGVEQSLVYYIALKEAGVPVEMHLYAHGGHAFGLRPSPFPIAAWPGLVEAWLRTIGIVPR